MSRQLLSVMLVVLVVSVFMIGGCTQQEGEPVSGTSSEVPGDEPQEMIKKPNVSEEEFVSELQDVKNSVDELGEVLS